MTRRELIGQAVSYGVEEAVSEPTLISLIPGKACFSDGSSVRLPDCLEVGRQGDDWTLFFDWPHGEGLGRGLAFDARIERERFIDAVGWLLYDYRRLCQKGKADGA